MTHDEVNSPEHYTSDGLEAIDVIESFGLGYHLGNVIKYVLRSSKKGNELIDLKKAEWYLQRYIDILENQTVESPKEINETHSVQWTITEDDLFRHGDPTMKCVVLRRHKVEMERKLDQITKVMDDMGCER